MKKIVILGIMLCAFFITSCSKDDESIYSYYLNSDSTGYIVKGNNTSGVKEFKIDSTYNNLPIVGIDDEIFKKNTTLETVDLSNLTNLKSIGYSAFRECDSLTSVTFPQILDSIGDYCFYGCSELDTVNFDDLTELTYLGSFSFSGCLDLMTADLENSKITKLNSDTFSECETLSNVSLPSRLEEIGDHAYFNCTSIVSFTLPTSLKYLRKAAFGGCSSATFSSIILPSSLIEIEESVFIDCIYLNTIDLSNCNKLTDIGIKAFYNCKRLNTFRINSNLVNFIEGSKMFYNAGTTGSGITLYTGSNTTSIPSYMFYLKDSTYKPKVTKVVLDSSVTTINKYAFNGLSSLTGIYYKGNSEDYSNIIISEGNDIFRNTDVYYYSEEEPTTNKSNYWHYVNNIVTIWS